MIHVHLERWVWTSLPLGAHTQDTAFQGPCWWKQQALPHFLCHQGTPYPQWKCSLGKHVPVAPCALHERPDIGSPLAYVGHHCKRPMQCWGVAMQTLSLMGLPVSTACFPYSFLDSQQTLVQWGQPEKLRSHGVHSGLGNTLAPSCLSSSLIGCAVDAIDVQLGLETDLHLPDAPFVDQKTRGAARYPKTPARDGYCHGTWRSMQLKPSVDTDIHCHVRWHECGGRSVKS